MKLATIRTETGTQAVLVRNNSLVGIAGVRDVGELLANPDWRSQAAQASGDSYAVETAEFAPVVPRPSKILCIGLNYQKHIQEMGRELPEHPTIFNKFPEALVGARDDIVLPSESQQVDWEAELAVVLGQKIRGASLPEAEAAIAGYSILNDVTMRDYQYRTTQWLQGKSWEACTPLGPYLTTADDFHLGATLVGEVNNRIVQEASTGDLVFSPADLIAYISTIFTLNPGDVIATGTPAGVGHAQKPAQYLHHGDQLITSIEGLGSLSNRIIRTH